MSPLQEYQNKVMEEFGDFFWELGKYNGRPLGIEEYKKFISQALSNQLQVVRDMIEKKEKELRLLPSSYEDITEARINGQIIGMKFILSLLNSK